MPGAARAVVVAGILASLAAAPARAAEPVPDADAERDSFGRVNAARADAGLGPLRWRDGLASIARDHSAEMARRNTLFHDPATPGRAGPLRRYGENVGRGASSGSIHVAFMRSDAHRRNVVGDFEEMGVGAVRAGDTLWLTQVFVSRPREEAKTTSVTPSKPRARKVAARPHAVRVAAPAPERPARAPRRAEPVMIERLASMMAREAD